MKSPADIVAREQAIARGLVAWPAVLLAFGLFVWWGAGRYDIATWIFAAAVVPVLGALLVQVVQSLRQRDVGLDIVALLSMSGALLLGETLAGNVVALMYAGGQLLENYASNRARREMTALLARAPKTAMRYADGGLVEVATDALRPGDRVLVRTGDVVPVDGVVTSETALVDQSALTGESLPVRRVTGTEVLSGSVNAAAAFDIRTTKRAEDSTYAGIVRLVEAAQKTKAPMVRIADRYAIWFLLVTVVVAGGAWLATGDPVRALAVLVVATPCPLILAVPVAIVSGVSLAARHGVLVKGGGVLERLARVRSLVIDKTGTLTVGRASLVATHALNHFPEAEILRFAASLDQASNHVIAEALVSAARERGLALSPPQDVREVAGAGLEGIVDGRRVTIGGIGFVRERCGIDDLPLPAETEREGNIVVAVAIDGVAAGALVLADEIRPEAAMVLTAFRQRGIDRIVLASGDHADVTNAVAAELDVDEVKSGLTPGEKVEAVLAEREHGPVMMIGDGVNDAPALAAADVGIAMGARGAAPSSESADAVLLVDRLDRIAEVMDVARRSRRIALQSVYVGIGLSFAAMGFAALGYLPPVQGALLQELIDVAVIVNALRALRDRPAGEPIAGGPTAAMARA